MLKTANTYNYEIEADYNGSESNPFKVSAAFTTNYKFGEATSRLYDEDGSISKHGTAVAGEYMPAFYASLKLQDFTPVENNKISAEFLYALNGAADGINSGTSVGGDIRYTLSLNEGISIPIGVSVGWYEKNIDILGGIASISSDRSTVDFRDALSIGYGAGIRYAAGPLAVDANIAGAYSNIQHIYRDPLSIASLSLDMMCTYQDKVFLGAGLVAGTLFDAEWKTKDDELAQSKESYNHTFSFANNFGYEVYAGLKFQKNCRFVIGFNQNKGLAMNRTLESRADGQYKYKQADTEGSDGLLETGGLFVKMAFSF
jgi:hypothetical protein